jgi:hypothetical protein
MIKPAGRLHISVSKLFQCIVNLCHIYAANRLINPFIELISFTPLNSLHSTHFLHSMPRKLEYLKTRAYRNMLRITFRRKPENIA